jgi:hypothetical protein
MRQANRFCVPILAATMSLIGSGCATFAGGGLPDISPTPPDEPPVIEQTIGDFSFHLDGGKMVSSVKAGRNLNREILRRWKHSGYIASETYVKSSQFSGKADYNLTLEGHQEGESSVGMQVISGLTLLLIPYWVHSEHDLRYVLEHVESGRKFEATASDRYTSVVGLLLAPVSLFLQGGAMKTWTRLGNHLYEDLSAQGAFDPDSWPAAPITPPQQTEEVPRAPATTSPPAPAPAIAPPPSDGDDRVTRRLRRLEQLREDGLISEEEYERKRDEILGDL